VTENQSAHQSIPLLTSTEQQLAKIRRQLEGLFTELRLLQDVIIVSGEACKAENTYVEGSLEHVLRRCGSDRVFRAMKTLTEIIERFGGTTDMTEERKADEQSRATCSIGDQGKAA
jgi:hypothetical protein